VNTTSQSSFRFMSRRRGDAWKKTKERCDLPRGGRKIALFASISEE
jgi:hypothetical protein